MTLETHVWPFQGFLLSINPEVTGTFCKATDFFQVWKLLILISLQGKEKPKGRPSRPSQADLVLTEGVHWVALD